MSELSRLLDDSSDELALALLRSASDDSPSTESVSAAAVLLGLGAGLGGPAMLASSLPGSAASAAGGAAAGLSPQLAALGAAPVATAGTTLTFAAIAKQVVIGMASGLFAVGSLELVLDDPFGPAPSTLTRAAATEPAAARVKSDANANAPARAALPEALTPLSATLPAAEAVARDSLEHAAPPPRAVPRRATLTAGATQAPAATVADAAPTPTPALVEPGVIAPKPAQAVELNKSLAIEVALLDRARSALLAQNPAGALSALAQYRKERQTGILDPEATVLQIQALEKRGDHAGAARMARQFVASHPGSRHVDSLRVLIGEAP